jgi:hypothetical protein
LKKQPLLFTITGFQPLAQLPKNATGTRLFAYGATCKDHQPGGKPPPRLIVRFNSKGNSFMTSAFTGKLTYLSAEDDPELYTFGLVCPQCYKPLVNYHRTLFIRRCWGCGFKDRVELVLAHHE